MLEEREEDGWSGRECPQRGETEGEGNGGDEEGLAQVGCFREIVGLCKTDGKATYAEGGIWKIGGCKVVSW